MSQNPFIIRKKRNPFVISQSLRRLQTIIPLSEKSGRTLNTTELNYLARTMPVGTKIEEGVYVGYDYVLTGTPPFKL